MFFSKENRVKELHYFELIPEILGSPLSGRSRLKCCWYKGYENFIPGHRSISRSHALISGSVIRSSFALLLDFLYFWSVRSFDLVHCTERSTSKLSVRLLFFLIRLNDWINLWINDWINLNKRFPSDGFPLIWSFDCFDNNIPKHCS